MSTLLEKSISQSAFIIAFLASLCEVWENGKLDENEASEIYDSTLSKALQNFEIPGPPEQESAPMMLYPRVVPWKAAELERRASINPNNLVKLIKQCNGMGISTDEILNTLAKIAISLPEKKAQDALHDTFLPFVSGLCRYLGAMRDDCPPTSTEKTCIVQVIEAYSTHYVRSEPRPPSDWRRKTTAPVPTAGCCGLSFTTHRREWKIFRWQKGAGDIWSTSSAAPLRKRQSRGDHRTP